MIEAQTMPHFMNQYTRKPVLARDAVHPDVSIRQGKCLPFWKPSLMENIYIHPVGFTEVISGQPVRYHTATTFRVK